MPTSLVLQQPAAVPQWPTTPTSERASPFDAQSPLSRAAQSWQDLLEDDARPLDCTPQHTQLPAVGFGPTPLPSPPPTPRYGSPVQAVPTNKAHTATELPDIDAMAPVWHNAYSPGEKPSVTQGLDTASLVAVQGAMPRLLRTRRFLAAIVSATLGVVLRAIRTAVLTTVASVVQAFAGPTRQSVVGPLPQHSKAEAPQLPELPELPLWLASGVYDEAFSSPWK